MLCKVLIVLLVMNLNEDNKAPVNPGANHWYIVYNMFATNKTSQPTDSQLATAILLYAFIIALTYFLFSLTVATLINICKQVLQSYTGCCFCFLPAESVVMGFRILLDMLLDIVSNVGINLLAPQSFDSFGLP